MARSQPIDEPNQAGRQSETGENDADVKQFHKSASDGPASIDTGSGVKCGSKGIGRA
jgi:hypothetical protein